MTTKPKSVETHHPLLARQLKHHFGVPEAAPEELHPFLLEVDAAYRKADQDLALISRSLKEMSDELNEHNGILKRERDEQKALAERLEEAHNQLLQSEKMASIGQLAAGVAHEINNPIGYVNSNFKTLAEYVQDLFAMLEAYQAAEPDLPDAARAKVAALRQELDLEFLQSDLGSIVRESQEGIDRVKKIVADLKEFSHPDESNLVWADLHAGIDSTLNIVSNEVKYKADVVREYGQIPEIECFPSQLNQVFMNLFVNAAQAMSGEPRGTITVRTSAPDEKTVLVEVVDNGSGISPANLQKIFDPFFTTKPVGQGTGLGLSLSYGIIQKHGGKFEVSSVLGQGTTFRIRLPVQR